jgi:hypothetical protein
LLHAGKFFDFAPIIVDSHCPREKLTAKVCDILMPLFANSNFRRASGDCRACRIFLP